MPGTLRPLRAQRALPVRVSPARLPRRKAVTSCRWPGHGYIIARRSICSAQIRTAPRRPGGSSRPPSKADTNARRAGPGWGGFAPLLPWRVPCEIRRRAQACSLRPQAPKPGWRGAGRRPWAGVPVRRAELVGGSDGASRTAERRRGHRARRRRDGPRARAVPPPLPALLTQRARSGAGRVAAVQKQAPSRRSADPQTRGRRPRPALARAAGRAASAVGPKRTPLPGCRRRRRRRRCFVVPAAAAGGKAGAGAVDAAVAPAAALRAVGRAGFGSRGREGEGDREDPPTSSQISPAPTQRPYPTHTHARHRRAPAAPHTRAALSRRAIETQPARA